MWTVVYITQNKEEAEQWQKKLTAEGFLVKIRPLGSGQSDNNSSYEILVPASEVDEAMEIFNTF